MLRYSYERTFTTTQSCYSLFLSTVSPWYISTDHLCVADRYNWGNAATYQIPWLHFYQSDSPLITILLETTFYTIFASSLSKQDSVFRAQDFTWPKQNSSRSKNIARISQKIHFSKIMVLRLLRSSCFVALTEFQCTLFIN